MWATATLCVLAWLSGALCAMVAMVAMGAIIKHKVEGEMKKQEERRNEFFSNDK